MNLEAVQDYKNFVNSLDESSIFKLSYRGSFRSEYVLGKTMINVYIYIFNEESLCVKWKMYNEYLNIDRMMTGEEVFSALPNKYKDEAIFYMDLFSFINTDKTFHYY